MPAGPANQNGQAASLIKTSPLYPPNAAVVASSSAAGVMSQGGVNLRMGSTEQPGQTSMQQVSYCFNIYQVKYQLSILSRLNYILLIHLMTELYVNAREKRQNVLSFTKG